MFIWKSRVSRLGNVKNLGAVSEANIVPAYSTKFRNMSFAPLRIFAPDGQRFKSEKRLKSTIIGMIK